MVENDNEKKDPSTITAGLIGAAVGAVVAAGTIALSDGKNRKKVEKLLSEIKDRGSKIMDLIQKEAGGLKKIAETGAKKKSK